MLKINSSVAFAGDGRTYANFLVFTMQTFLCMKFRKPLSNYFVVYPNIFTLSQHFIISVVSGAFFPTLIQFNIGKKLKEMLNDNLCTQRVSCTFYTLYGSNNFNLSNFIVHLSFTSFMALCKYVNDFYNLISLSESLFVIKSTVDIIVRLKFIFIF